MDIARDARIVDHSQWKEAHMSAAESSQSGQWPDWFKSEDIDTIIVAFPDVFGQIMGKRTSYDFFVNHIAGSGMHACNYLMAVDLEMNVVGGFKLADWHKGFGDFTIRPCPSTLRRLPWLAGTAIVLGDMFTQTGNAVEEAPRHVLSRQIERLANAGHTACIGSELEFHLFHETNQSVRKKGFRDLTHASDYAIDYHILEPGRDEDVLRRIRNEMSEARIPVECSKGETGRGQHEINLVFAEAMEMADRHVIYKAGVKDIARQQDKIITFMPKLFEDESGNGLHIHVNVWDDARKTNLFHDPRSGGESVLFRQFTGGLLKYGRELTYFFAPTINSYKRYQTGSWAPTAVAFGRDNRTCGLRMVGHGNSLRVENRMPGADANPYLAFAATLAAGLRGIEENLDCGDAFDGNAYADKTLPRLPGSLDEAADLLQHSDLARSALGTDVVDFYVHTARTEVETFRRTVTDWERYRYFERI